MSYKILEANGVDNENIDGGALNNLIVKDKNGIVNGVLSECALTATGSLIGISPGLLILHGIRVKITKTETLTLTNVPATATKYQIVAQVVLWADRSVEFSFLVQEPTALKQDELYAANEGTYQIEFGTFTQNTDGTLVNLKRVAQKLFESEKQLREDLDAVIEDVSLLQESTAKNAQTVETNTASIEAIRESIRLFGVDQDTQDLSIAKNSADIQNLFSIARENNQFAVLTTEQAYTTRQTARGKEIFDDQYTAVTEIKGSTVKDENLIPFPYTYDSYTSNGITFTVKDDGSITIKTDASGATNETYFFINSRQSLAAGTYYLAGVPNPASASTFYIRLQEDGQAPIDDLGSGKFFTISTSGVYMLTINIKAGAVITNPVTIKPVLYSGSAIRSFIPRFNGLKHAFIKLIKSTGRNLYDFELDKGNVYIANGTVLSTTIAGYECKGNLGATPYTYSYDNGWLYFNGNNTKALPILEVGTTLKVSFDITLLETVEGYESFRLGCYLVEIGEENKYFYLKNITTTQSFTVSFVVKRLPPIGYTRFAVSVGSLHYVIENFTVNIGNTAYPREPYTEDIYELPQELIALYANGIPEYDRFYPQTGELIRQTGYATSETGFTEEEIAGYDGAIVSSDNLSLEYKLATPTIEKIENAPKQYKSWKHGSETVIQGETDNSIYGAMSTVTNEYFVAVGAEEGTNE